MITFRGLAIASSLAQKVWKTSKICPPRTLLKGKAGPLQQKLSALTINSNSKIRLVTYARIIVFAKRLTMNYQRCCPSQRRRQSTSLKALQQPLVSHRNLSKRESRLLRLFLKCHNCPQKINLSWPAPEWNHPQPRSQ